MLGNAGPARSRKTSCRSRTPLRRFGLRRDTSSRGGRWNDGEIRHPLQNLGPEERERIERFVRGVMTRAPAMPGVSSKLPASATITSAAHAHDFSIQRRSSCAIRPRREPGRLLGIPCATVGLTDRPISCARPPRATSDAARPLPRLKMDSAGATCNGRDAVAYYWCRSFSSGPANGRVTAALGS